ERSLVEVDVLRPAARPARARARADPEAKSKVGPQSGHERPQTRSMTDGFSEPELENEIDSLSPKISVLKGEGRTRRAHQSIAQRRLRGVDAKVNLLTRADHVVHV